MKNRTPAEVFPPGEYLRDEIVARGWTQSEFADLIRRPARVISEIIAGKRGVTPETAQAIGAALGTSAQYWLNLDSAYQLGKTSPAPEEINREARLREKFPVREMAKRGWIENSNNSAVLESRVFNFFEITSLDDSPGFTHAAKRRGYDLKLSSLQLAWLFRVKQIAEVLPTPRYSSKILKQILPSLHALLSAPEETRQVPAMLNEAGVRFVLVEGLPGAKVDGVCLWLDDSSPVIGISLRYDRIDNFWFVLRHEINHVLKRDGQKNKFPVKIDIELEGRRASTDENIPEQEREANRAAQEFLVPKDKLEKFIARVHPLYSDERIVRFANSLGVHPGLVVGQLQFLDKLPYTHFKKHIKRVREFVTRASITDGWGHLLPI